MAATQQEKAKLEGKVMGVVKSCKAEQVWPLWADFCGIHKWFPNLATCHLIEGEVGNEVGSVRHCVGKVVEGRKAVWAKEKLIEIDHEKRLMRYEVLENTFGLRGYAAMIRVYDSEEEGCIVEWWFEVEELDGVSLECFQGYVQSSLDFILKKMEEAIRILP